MGTKCFPHLRYERMTNILVRRNEGKRPLGRPVCRWDNYIQMGIKDIILDSVSSVNAVLNLRVT